MAIEALRPQDNASLTLTLTNGELKALQDIMEKWKFKDEKSFLEFALAILVTPGLLLIKRDGEQIVRVEPADSLLKSSQLPSQQPDAEQASTAQ